MEELPKHGDPENPTPPPAPQGQTTLPDSAAPEEAGCAGANPRSNSSVPGQEASKDGSFHPVKLESARPSTAADMNGMSEDDDDEDKAHNYVPKDLDDALKPRVGMVFGSIQEAFSFYRTYAYRKGFSAVRRTCHNYEGSRYRSTFTCRHGGKVVPDEPTKLNRYPLRRRGRSVERTECKASMIIRDKKLDDRWKVEFLEQEHNHPCIPDMVRFVKCFRELPEPVKKQYKIRDEWGESVEQSINEITETRKFPTRPKRGVRNAVGLWLSEGDMDALMIFFDTIRAKTPNFSYNWDFDEEGHLRNVFWADARCRAAYQYFGDVVALDVMYLSGHGTTPLAAFVGVNNHGQFVSLGCGLLADETKETYIWLLRKWLRCMNGKPPDAITTNYCDVTAEAVAEVLPDVRHRFCLWNIMKKLNEKIGNVPEREVIGSRFKKVVYDALTVTDFEKEWGEMIEQLRLGDNEWLSSLYGCRKQWAPVYVNHSFWAGMSAIRRTEKPEAFFEGQVSAKTTLQMFLEHYDATLKAKLEKEAYDDLRSFYSRPQTVSGMQFEDQMADLYTYSMFQIFQDEIKQLMNIICKEADRSGPVVTYMVSELAEGKKVDYTVVYNSAERDVWCICRSFQSRGILCSHALAVLRQEYVMLIPAKYILDRWRKDFKPLRSSIDSNNATPEQELGNYDDLYKRGHQYFADIVDIGSREPELKDFVLSVVKEARDKVLTYEETQGDRRVDMNIASTTSNGGHSYSMVNVNLENEPLPMAPTNFMQIQPTILPHKRLVSQRDNANKNANVDRNTYFMSGGIHM